MGSTANTGNGRHRDALRRDHGRLDAAAAPGPRGRSGPPGRRLVQRRLSPPHVTPENQPNDTIGSRSSRVGVDASYPREGGARLPPARTDDGHRATPRRRRDLDGPLDAGRRLHFLSASAISQSSRTSAASATRDRQEFAAFGRVTLRHERVRAIQRAPQGPEAHPARSPITRIRRAGRRAGVTARPPGLATSSSTAAWGGTAPSRGRDPGHDLTANALIVAPDAAFREIPATTSSPAPWSSPPIRYGVIGVNWPRRWEDRFAELNLLACDLAKEAREQAGEAGKGVRIAGSLPPLRGSYRPDLVGPFEEIFPRYQEQAGILAPHVDLLLCETMSGGAEAYGAARAAVETGLPVWVSFTLHENHSGLLRSGETVAEAVAKLEDLPISGILANCCAPESITAAMPDLVATGAEVVGGYANTFLPVPENWTLDGDQDWDGVDRRARRSRSWSVW